MSTSVASRTVWRDRSFITDIPANGAVVRVYRDYWWAVNEQGQVGFFDGVHPQCNPDRRIVESLHTSVAQIPVAFINVTVEA